MLGIAPYFLFLLPAICLGGLVVERAMLETTDPTGGLCDTGKSQSPINIYSTCVNAKLDRLLPKGHSDPRPQGFTLANTGHGAQISFSGLAPVLRGGPLSDEYTLEQLHFHWGSSKDRGSEHSISSKFYAMEAHFVHYKTMYGSFENATNYPDGLAVIGIMFKLISKDNEEFKETVSSLSKIRKSGSTTTLSSGAMNWFKMVQQRFDYYTYQGSLTTAPCTENVTWLVIENGKIPISKSQIAEFRTLLDDKKKLVLGNSRSIQKSNGRVVRCGKGKSL